MISLKWREEEEEEVLLKLDDDDRRAGGRGRQPRLAVSLAVSRYLARFKQTTLDRKPPIMH